MEKKELSSQPLGSWVHFLAKAALVVAIATPLCWVGGLISGAPTSRMARAALYLGYWVALGATVNSVWGEFTVALPTGRQVGLWKALTWLDVHIFVGAQVFRGVRALPHLDGGAWNALAICVVVGGIYAGCWGMARLYALGRRLAYRREPSRQMTGREAVQIEFALSQKSAPFWMATGTGPATGLILGIVALVANLYRIAVLTWVLAKEPKDGDKGLTRPQVVGKLLKNGPMVGLVFGAAALLLEWLGGLTTPKMVMGLADTLSYPYVPAALFLMGTGGLGKAVTAKWAGARKGLAGPLLFVVLGSLGIVPLAAHVACGSLYVWGFMGHEPALGLAQFFSHACSPIAWGLVALFLGKEDARFFLLLIVATMVGSIISVPIIYGTCGF